MLLILALTFGCLVTAGYKDVSAATFEDMFDQEISLNEYGSFQLNFEQATVFKFDLPADGSFVIDFAPKKIYANAELYDAQGNKIGKTLGSTGSSFSYGSFEWKNLKAGVHYLRIWGHNKASDKSGIDVAFYTRSERSSDVVWKIGITLKRSGTVQLSKIFENCSDKDSHWVSEDKKIATVTEDGKVKGKAKGKTVIKLISSSGTVAKINVEVVKKSK